MGYTHYWRIKRNLTKEEWELFTNAVKHIIERADVKICNGVGERKPIINKDRVVFNGCAECGEDYETFSVERRSEEYGENHFDFCKTAREPYDKVVCACLVVLEKILKEDIKVSSDGFREPTYRCGEHYDPDEGWIEGKKLASVAMGHYNIH